MKSHRALVKACHQRVGHRGYTLIEITLVMGLLLGLIAALFIGISAYKNGSDRAQCLLFQTTCQKAVRAYELLESHNPGDPADVSSILGANLYGPVPKTVCPGGGTLTYAPGIPAENAPWVTCSIPSHVPPTSPP